MTEYLWRAKLTIEKKMFYYGTGECSNIQGVTLMDNVVCETYLNKDTIKIYYDDLHVLSVC